MSSQLPNATDLCSLKQMGDNLERSASLIGALATRIMIEMTGEDVEVDYFDRGALISPSSKADHTLRVRRRRQRELTEIGRARIMPGGIDAAFATLVDMVVTSRARNAVIHAWQQSHHQIDWNLLQLRHPVLAMIKERRFDMNTSGRYTTTRLLPEIDDQKRKIALTLGTPDIPWTTRRPTTLEIDLTLPETIVAALAGRPLSAVMEPDLPPIQAKAYSGISIVTAKTIGTGTRRGIHLALSPCTPAASGEPIGNNKLMQTWRAYTQSPQAI